MNQLSISPDVLTIINILINVLAVIIAGAITAYLGAASWATVRSAWKLARGYVNDPTDKGMIWLEKHTGIAAAVWSSLLTLAGDSVLSNGPTPEAAALPDRLQPVPLAPAQEHAPE
jgi:hypothetical protein